MKWWIVLFLVSFAAALPHDKGRPQQVRRVVAQRRTPAAPIQVQAGARIPSPVKAPVRRVQAIRVVPTKSISHVRNPVRTVAVPAPFKPAFPKPGIAQRVKNFPGHRTLTKEESEALQRQIQQWQIAVVGGQVQPPYPGAPQPPPSGPPYPGGPAVPAGPGTIWIQVPAGGYPYPPTYPPTYPQPGPPAPPSQPQPAPPSQPEPETPTIPEASQGSEQPLPVGPEEASEGVEPVEEAPTGGETLPPLQPLPSEEGSEPPDSESQTQPTAEQGGQPEAPTEEGVEPHEEAPPAEPVAPEGGAEGSAPQEETPFEEIPAAGGEGPTGEGAGPPVVPPPSGAGGGDEQDKLVHCKEARGQFPHESSCSKFYNCWDDVVVEGSCPFGLVFSEEHSYCDFPENVDCGERTLDDTSNSIEENGGCTSPYGSYRSNTNCSEFFICDNGTPIMFACPAELFYNDELGVCDYPYRVNCQNPPAPETPPAELEGGGTEGPAAETPGDAAPESPPPAEQTAPAEELPATIPDALRKLPPSFLKAGSPCWHRNVYPLNNVCSRVAVCRSGTTSILACPKGMAYDVHKRRCLPYYRARC
ncbi:uncharacterized protein [Hetaerina americana]|uniref:uncharacterized protein n=1 Tax=Hetaerina americana TaxID=62018 RepID=UPI003A7F5B81